MEEISWRGGNFPGGEILLGAILHGGNYPGGNFPREQLSSEAIARGNNYVAGNHPGGSYPGDNHPGGNFPRGQLCYNLVKPLKRKTAENYFDLSITRSRLKLKIEKLFLY